MIGVQQEQIIGSKLPSNRDVLSVLLFNMTKNRLGKQNNTTSVIQQVFDFWKKARIPTQPEWYCIDKLKSLHYAYKARIKHIGRVPTENEKTFDDSLDDLFDIAAQDAEKRITKEDKQFLINQRKKGREGSFLEVDVNVQEKEEQKEKRKHDRVESERKRKAKSADADKNHHDADKQVYERGKE